MVNASNLKRTSPRRTSRLLSSLLLLLLVFAFAHATNSLAQAQRRPAPRLFGETQVYEWQKLESFVRYLKRRPRERGHVVVYTSRVSNYSSPDGAARIKILEEKLFENMDIKPGRVALVEGGLREQATVELWVLARGAKPPEPTPTAPRESMIICPHIRAAGETYLLRANGPLTFGVSLRDGDPSVRPTFRWTVSHGTILSGQGSDKITVGELDASPKVVAAEVEVLGLPAGCESRGKMETGVGVAPYKWDDYPNITIGDEKARLDNFHHTLNEEPELVAYVLVYGGRGGRRDEAQRRADRAVDYLVNARGLGADRVRAVDGGLRESLAVELWVSTRGGPAPVPAPTVVPKPAPRNTNGLPKPRRGAR